jgi:hypothetical protein
VRLASSVIPADRRGADHGSDLTEGQRICWDRDAGPFKSTESRTMYYGVGTAVRSLQVSEHRKGASPFNVPVRRWVSCIPSLLSS